MVLLDDVVEIFDLTNHDRNILAGIDLSDCRFIGSAFIHGDFFRNIAIPQSLAEKALGRCLIALCRQEYVDRYTLIVNRTTGIFLGALSP